MTYLSMIIVIAFVYKIGVIPGKKKGKISCTNFTYILCSNLVEHVPSSSTSSKPLKITTNLLRGLYFLISSPWKPSGNILLHSELIILQNLIWFIPLIFFQLKKSNNKYKKERRRPLKP